MLKIDVKKQQAREVCPGGCSIYKLEIFPVFSLQWEKRALQMLSCLS